VDAESMIDDDSYPHRITMELTHLCLELNASFMLNQLRKVVISKIIVERKLAACRWVTNSMKADVVKHY
jgi:hypothetical protein